MLEYDQLLFSAGDSFIFLPYLLCIFIHAGTRLVKQVELSEVALLECPHEPLLSLFHVLNLFYFISLLISKLIFLAAAFLFIDCFLVVCFKSGYLLISCYYFLLKTCDIILLFLCIFGQLNLPDIGLCLVVL